MAHVSILVEVKWANMMLYKRNYPFDDMKPQRQALRSV